MIITSKTNNVIKYVSSLKSKKYRNKYNKYVIEGIKLVEEIINSEGEAPEFIIYSREILETLNNGDKLLIDITKHQKLNVIEVSKEIFNYLSDTENSQGVLAVVDKNEMHYLDLINNLENDKNGKYIILDKIQDPGNLGTIIRTALSFNIANIICLKGTVDIFSSKVIRSTMGAINKANIYTIDDEEIENTMLNLKKYGYALASTSLDAKSYIRDEKISTKTIFIMGNEANGVRENIAKLCDKKIKIPMSENMESLNVSIASAICMYEQYIRSE